MKKILSLLSIIGISASTSSVVVSCNDTASFDYYADQIKSEMRTVVYVDDSNYAYDMTNYFNEDGSISLTPKTADSSEVKTSYLSFVFGSNSDADDDSGDDDGGNTPTVTGKIDKDIITSVAIQAANTIVSSGKSNTDYKLNVTESAKEDSFSFDFESVKGSKAWTGSCKFDISISKETPTEGAN